MSVTANSPRSNEIATVSNPVLLCSKLQITGLCEALSATIQYIGLFNALADIAYQLYNAIFLQQKNKGL